jgi:nucleoid-associated protein EbfC
MAGPFKGMPGMGNLGNAGMQKMIENLQKKIVEDAEKMQERLEAARFEATSGGGAVKAVTDGHGHLLELKISPEAVDPNDVEMLQDLVMTAVCEALDKAESTREEEQQKLSQAMPRIPGLF